MSEYPVLPLRDMVVYPHGVHPLFVGTASSILALDAAMAADNFAPTVNRMFENIRRVAHGEPLPEADVVVP